MPLPPASATGRRAALAALAGLVLARGAATAAAEPAPRSVTPDGLGARSGLLVFRAALPGGAALTLVPSSHAPDARLPRISSEAVLRGASRLLIETETPPEGIPPEWTLLRPGEPAPPPAALLPPELLARLDARLRCAGTDPALTARIRPFALASAVQAPCPPPGPNRAPSAESWLIGAANVLGLPVSGLESAPEAFAALFAVPDPVWWSGLIETLRRPAAAEALQEEARRAYEAGELDRVRALTAAAISPDPVGRALFDRAVIVGRNLRVAPRLAEAARRGPAAAVIGAAHFPGPDGLVALLQELGLRVEPSRLRLAA